MAPDQVTSPLIPFDQHAGISIIGNGTDASAELNEAPTLTTRALIKASILALMAGASISANLSTLVSIVVGRKYKGSTLYTLLFQLAVADLLVSIWCLSGEAAWTYTVEWKGGQILCKIFKFSQVFSLYLSTSTMVLIGFDRLLAIRRPINHRSCFRPIGCAWAISALLATPQLAIFRVLEGPFSETFYQCVTYGFYTEEWQEQLYSIFSLLSMFVIPLFTLIGCYVCIFYTIAKEKERALLGRSTPQSMDVLHHSRPQNDRSRPITRQSPTIVLTSSITDPRRDILKRAKMKSLRISIIIVSAFIICWAPYYFMMITFIFLDPDEKLGEELQSAIFFFGMSNSLINPLIYGAFHLCRPSNLVGMKGRILDRSSPIMRESKTRDGLMTPGADGTRINRLRRPNSESLLTSCAISSGPQQHRRRSLVPTNGHASPPSGCHSMANGTTDRDVGASSSITYL